MTNLYLKFSDYSIIRPFHKSKLSSTSLAVIEEFEFTKDLVEMPLDKLVDLLVLHGKNCYDDPQAVALALKKTAHSSYRLPQSMTDSLNLAMASSIHVIRTVQEQLKSLKKAIEDHLETIPQTLDTVPGIGPIFASGILAKVDINQFKNHKGLVKYTGLSWAQNQSGDFNS